MNTLSRCKITFDPDATARVLVDHGDEIPQENKPVLRKGVEVVAIVDALAPFLRSSGNHVYSFRIDVFQDETTDALAWQRVFESLIAVQGLDRKPLRVEVLGITDRYWQFASSMITDHAPERVTDHGVAARYVRSYSVTATGLSQVGP